MGGGLDAFVGPGRGHADVGHHHGGLDLLHQRQQAGKVVSRSHQIHAVLLGDELLHALSQECVVLRQHYPDTVHGRQP